MTEKAFSGETVGEMFEKYDGVIDVKRCLKYARLLVYQGKAQEKDPNDTLRRVCSEAFERVQDAEKAGEIVEKPKSQRWRKPAASDETDGRSVAAPEVAKDDDIPF